VAEPRVRLGPVLEPEGLEAENDATWRGRKPLSEHLVDPAGTLALCRRVSFEKGGDVVAMQGQPECDPPPRVREHVHQRDENVGRLDHIGPTELAFIETQGDMAGELGERSLIEPE